LINDDDIKFMEIAIEMAKKGLAADEVPVGALLIDNNGKILSSAFNMPIAMNDPTAHAEILCIREACQKTGNYRLNGDTLYVTIEPCPMCAGAIINARIKRVVFGGFDLKAGACGTLYNIVNDQRLNHRVEVISGVLRDECVSVLQEFFRKKRC
jgi:tRNA(adenine34) deaminase